MTSGSREVGTAQENFPVLGTESTMQPMGLMLVDVPRSRTMETRPGVVGWKMGVRYFGMRARFIAADCYSQSR